MVLVPRIDAGLISYIEQLDNLGKESALAKSECTKEWRPVLKGTDYEKAITYLLQPRCKMWDCPYCAELNKSEWRRRVSEGVEWYRMFQMREWRFVTITSHPKLKTRSQTLYVWPKAWAKLSRRMRYKFAALRYVLLPEQHKDGRLHIHMICNAAITRPWLKTHCPACGLGYKVDTQEIHSGSATFKYVTKYLNKAIADTQWPRSFRRVRTSQRWPKLDAGDSEGFGDVQWQYVSTYPKEGLEYLATEMALRSAFDVKIL